MYNRTFQTFSHIMRTATYRTLWGMQHNTPMPPSAGGSRPARISAGRHLTGPSRPATSACHGIRSRGVIGFIGVKSLPKARIRCSQTTPQ